jgi:hypothetical protein
MCENDAEPQYGDREYKEDIRHYSKAADAASKSLFQLLELSSTSKIITLGGGRLGC